MTILFVGNEDIDFGVQSGLSVVTDGGTSPITRCAVRAYAGESITTPSGFDDQTELWLHFQGSQSAVTASFGGPLFGIMKPDGTMAVALNGVTAGSPMTVNFQYSNGAGGIISSPNFTMGDRLVPYDLHVKISGTTIFIELFQDGELLVTVTDTLTAGYTMGDIFFRSNKWGNSAYVLSPSEVVVATVTTIGMRVFTRQPTGNGGETGFTGSYTDVDEVTVSGATDQITTNTPNTRSSFTRASITLTGTQVIRAVVVSAMGNSFDNSIDELNVFVRKSGVNYDGPAKALTPGNSRCNTIWETDPATGVAWDTSLVTGTTLEFGVRVS